VGFPERRVFEFLANLRLDELAFVLEIGQLVRTFVRREKHLFAAGIAGEIVGGRKARRDLVVALPVKRAPDVARRVGLYAVNGLVDDAQAKLGSRGRRPVGVASDDRVRSGVARPVFLLVRDYFDLEELTASRNVDALAALEHLALFHVSDAEI